jgi:hypothetical protein
MLKSMALLVIVFVPTVALADQAGSADNTKLSHGSGDKFQQAQKRKLELIDRRINRLQAARACIIAAPDAHAMNACRVIRDQSMGDPRDGDR